MNTAYVKDVQFYANAGVVQVIGFAECSYVKDVQFYANAGVVQVIGFAECSYYNGSKAANAGECNYQLRACSPGGDGYRFIAESNNIEELQEVFKQQPSSNKHYVIFKVKGE